MGALTAKPYAFTFRSWELTSLETFDCLDSWASNIRIDFRGLELVRVLPRLSFQDIKFEPLKGFSWISDKTRFSYDSLKTLRLTCPMLRIKNKLITINWIKTLNFITFFYFLILKNNIKVINKFIYTNELNKNKIINLNYTMGEFLENRALVLFKKIINFFPNSGYTSNLSQQQNIKQNIFRCAYYLDLNKISEKYKNIFLVNTNIRLEFPLLNVILRKLFHFYKNEFKVFNIGPKWNLNFFSFHISTNMRDFVNVLSGKNFLSYFFSKKKYYELNYFLFSEAVVARRDISNIFTLLMLKNKYRKFNFCFLQNNISNMTNIEYNLINSKRIFSKNYEINYICSNYPMDNLEKNQQNFNIFYGHHNSKGLINADLIIPTSTITEIRSAFVDLFGNIKNTKALFKAPFEARNSWQILYFFFRTFLKNLKIKTGLVKNNFWFRKSIEEIRVSIDLLSSYYAFDIYTKNDKIFLKENASAMFLKEQNSMYFLNTVFSFKYRNFKDLNILVKSSKIMNLAHKFFYEYRNFN